MFEMLSDYFVKEGSQRGPNAFWNLEESLITRAEDRAGFRFPEQLRSLLVEAGSGTIKAPQGQEREFTRSNFLNRFLGPSEMVDLYLGEPTESAPEEGFDAGELPFFEVGDQEYFVLRPGSDEPDAVHMAFGGLVAPDVLSFVNRLLEDPSFYLSL